MKIKSLQVFELNVPLITPFITAERRADEMTSIIVKLHTEDGRTGFGETAPVKPVTGETEETIVNALKGPLWNVVKDRDVNDIRLISEGISNALVGNTGAKSAMDIALYDLYGQFVNKPIYQLFGIARTHVDTDLTVSVREPKQMAEDAIRAVQRGFHTIKVKVGSEPEKDIARLIAIRKAVGKDVRIRIDANQGWSPEQAVKILDEMEKAGIDLELVEQPALKDDLEGLKYVTNHTNVPVVADESCFSPEDAEKIFSMGAADMVNIKLDKCGGLSKAAEIAVIAQKYDKQCMLGCMLEGKISVSAAMHLACAYRNITKIDLDGPMLCSEDPVDGGCVFAPPRITVSDGAGLDVHSVTGMKKLFEI